MNYQEWTKLFGGNNQRFMKVKCKVTIEDSDAIKPITVTSRTSVMNLYDQGIREIWLRRLVQLNSMLYQGVTQLYWEAVTTELPPWTITDNLVLCHTTFPYIIRQHVCVVYNLQLHALKVTLTNNGRVTSTYRTSDNQLLYCTSSCSRTWSPVQVLV